MQKEKNTKIIIYFITLTLLLILCYLFPYTWDDWNWGSQLGLDRLYNWFDNYNGRYVGNLITLALTRSRILRAIVMAIFITGIIFLINNMTGKNSKGLIMSLILFIALPAPILRQAVVWTSGFSNYTTSAFFFLCYVFYFGKIFENGEQVNSIRASICLFLLGAVSAPIVEHVTICNILLGLCSVIYTFIKYKKICIQYIAYLFGAIGGALYMFSNSVYKSIYNGDDWYRSIGRGENFIKKVTDSLTKIIVKEGFLNNVMLNCILCLVCVVIWKTNSSKINGTKKILGKLSIISIIVYTQISAINLLENVFQSEITNYLITIFTVIYALALFTFIIILPFEQPRKEKCIFYLLCAFCLMGPLLVVSPIGPRCFFASYIMYICVVLQLMESFELYKFIDISLIGSALAGETLIIFLIFTTIYTCDINRIAKAQADSLNYSEIEVENLPYNNYIHGANPTSGTTREYQFKLFYGIDENVSIKNVNSSIK